MYKGSNCYVWAPVIDKSIYSNDSSEEDDIDFSIKEDETDNDYTDTDNNDGLEEDLNGSSANSSEYLTEDDLLENNYDKIYDTASNYTDERSYHITDEMAEAAGEAFDDFYDDMIANFAEPVDADGTGKISLMMYDIQCGNKLSSYIGGFFSSGDLYEDENTMAMLHLDTYPSIYSPYPSGTPNVSKSFSTMAHEFQHLLNYSKYFNNVKDGVPNARQMDLWLNEAMSMAAEEMIFPESSLPSRISYYNSDYYGDIKNGHSLLDFNNHLESYSLSALFSAYLKNQTGDYQVFSRLLTEFTDSEEEAIEAAVSDSDLADLSFSDIIASYKIALAMNDENGLYGFYNDNLISELKPQVFIDEGESVNLKGGGSILIKTLDGKFIPPEDAGENICFIGMRKADDKVMIIQKPKDGLLVAGESFDLEAVSYTIDGESTDIDWSSSSEGVASVDENGLLLALSEGNTVITASNGLYSDKFKLTVEKTFVTIEKKKTSLYTNDSMTVTANIRSANNDEEITWTSTNTIVAEVTPEAFNSKNAVINALSSGETTIIATLNSRTRSIEADSFVLTVAEKPEVPDGLTADNNDKKMKITSSEDMYALAEIVNSTTPPIGMEDGLLDWEITLETNVELDDWIPIGQSGTTPFKGSFNGQDNKIIIHNTVDNLDFGGLFGVNSGTITNININIRGSVKGKIAGAVTGSNWSEIKHSVVTIDSSGELMQTREEPEKAGCGGIVGYNYMLVEDSYVTNNGSIGSPRSSPTGGIVGFNQGFKNGTAIVTDAVVYNNGTIISSDDTGGIVGHNQNWSGDGAPHKAKIDGNIDVTVTKQGKLISFESPSSSIGGVVGLVYGASEISGNIKVRIDGIIQSQHGNAGGFVGNGIPTQDANTTVAVTLGPESEIGKAASGFGVLFGEHATPNSRWVYAVPRGNTLPPFKGGSPNDTQLKRIEFPIEGNPDPTNKIDSITPLIILNDGTNGIFVKNDAIAVLNSDSVKDDTMLSLNVDAQTVTSLIETSPNYFDFNLFADGLEIVVPAYLDLDNEVIPQMSLDISSNNNNLKDTKQEAISQPAKDKESISIKAINARIINNDTDWTLKKLEGESFINYKPRQLIKPNTETAKDFTLMENGVYEISATAKAINGAETITKTKYLSIMDKGIEIEGNHLESQKTDNWTNLSENGKSVPDFMKIVPVKIEAFNTIIKEHTVKKEAVPYSIIVLADGSNPDIERNFSLYETGRYTISAKGAGIEQEVTKYVNIDIDCPEPPSLNAPENTEPITGGVLKLNKEYSINIPLENMIQSPIHIEASIDGGGFNLYSSKTIQLGAKTKTLELKTVDAATNESELVKYTFAEEALPPVPPVPPSGGGGGSSDNSKPSPPATVPDSLKHILRDDLVVNEQIVEKGYIYGYTDSTFRPNREVSRAELAAMLDRLLILDEPTPGTSSFTDTKGMWAEANVRRLSNAKIVLGVGGGNFAPNRSITREELAVMLTRALKLDEYPDTCPLTDISNSFASKEIAKAYNAGLITGYEDLTFKPKKNITRAEAVVMLNKIFLDSKQKEKENIFSDMNLSMWYYTEILRAIVLEIPAE